MRGESGPPPTRRAASRASIPQRASFATTATSTPRGGRSTSVRSRPMTRAGCTSPWGTPRARSCASIRRRARPGRCSAKTSADRAERWSSVTRTARSTASASSARRTTGSSCTAAMRGASVRAPTAGPGNTSQAVRYFSTPTSPTARASRGATSPSGGSWSEPRTARSGRSCISTTRATEPTSWASRPRPTARSAAAPPSRCASSAMLRARTRGCAATASASGTRSSGRATGSSSAPTPAASCWSGTRPARGYRPRRATPPRTPACTSTASPTSTGRTSSWRTRTAGRSSSRARPGYGYTGGGLLFWDRSTAAGTLVRHTDILPEHSTMSLAALPGGRILGGTTTAAGTGGAKKAGEAELYVMDMATKRVEWHEAALPGRPGLHRHVRSRGRVRRRLR